MRKSLLLLMYLFFPFSASRAAFRRSFPRDRPFPTARPFYFPRTSAPRRDNRHSGKRRRLCAISRKGFIDLTRARARYYTP